MQVITVNELALRKYMYHSQTSYIDRVRMHWECNKLLFLLYCIVTCVGDIVVLIKSKLIHFPYTWLVLTSRQKQIVEYLLN